MDKSVREIVSLLVQRVQALPEHGGTAPSVQRAAAIATNALPVYMGWNGSWLAVTPELDVVMFDEERLTVERVTEEQWRTLAFAHASHESPDLLCLRPGRPPHCPECAVCHGTTEGAGGRICRDCNGRGWLWRD